jgi:hypothetical protein
MRKGEAGAGAAMFRIESLRSGHAHAVRFAFSLLNQDVVGEEGDLKTILKKAKAVGHAM